MEKVFAVCLIFREEDRDTYFDNRDIDVFFLMFVQSFLIRTFPVFFSLIILESTRMAQLVPRG